MRYRPFYFEKTTHPFKGAGRGMKASNSSMAATLYQQFKGEKARSGVQLRRLISSSKRRDDERCEIVKDAD